MSNLAPVSAPFTSVHPTLPIGLAALSSTITALQAQLGRPEGALVVVEAIAAGAIYTVPIGKTFNGVVYLQAAGAGTVTVSAATGGTLAAETVVATAGGSAPDAVAVTVAGGGAGNAISLAVTGSVAVTSATLVGHVK